METQKILIEIDVDASQSTQEIVKQRADLEVLRKEKAELLAQNKLLAAQEKVDTETIQKNNAAIVEKEAKIKNLSAKIKSNEKIVQAATKTTQDETGAYQKLALEYQVAAQKAKDLAVVHGVNSEQAKKATAAANSMDAQLKEVDKSVGQNQRNVGNYSSALDGLTGGFFSSVKGINSFAGGNENLSGSLKGATGSVKAMGAELLTMLANPVVLAVAAVVGLGAAIVGLVKNSMEFSKEMSMLSAITGATGDDLNYLKESAKDLAYTYGKSAVEIVTAMKLVGSAKPELLENVQALKAVTESVLVLSKATGMDLTEATAGVTTIMNQFSLSADQANRTINVLAAGSKYGAVEVDYLKESISKVGTIANAANVSLEATVAAMELFGEKGIKAETAGTGFKSILGKLQADTANYTNGLFDLNKAIDNNAEISGNNLKLQEKFGVEFYGMAGILLTNKERFQELTTQVTGTQTAYEQMRIANDNLSGDTEKLGGAWDRFMLTIEDGNGIFSKFARFLTQLLTGLINDLTLFGKDVGNLVTWVVDSFGYIVKAVQGVGDTFKIVFSSISNAWEALKKGDFKGVAAAFSNIGDSISKAFDMSTVTKIIEQKKAIRENEESMRAAAKAAVESETEKQKALKETEELTKKQIAERNKLRDAEIKKTLDLITIEKNEYKDKYDVEKLLDDKYFESKKTALQKIHDDEIALIDKKKKYGKLTIEEEKLARAEADRNLIDSTNKLYSDLNVLLSDNIVYQLELDDLKNKQFIIGIKQTEEQKYQDTVNSINKRYEAEKKKIELSVKDENEKNKKLTILNAKYNLDIATANQANQDAIDKQKLIDEAELLQSKFELQQNGIDKEFQQKFDALEKEKNERLKKVTEGSEAEFAIKQEYAAKEAELERQKNLSKAQGIVDIAAKTMEVLESVNKFFDALGERELDNFKKLKDKELNITIENNNKAFDSVTANYNAELAKLNEQLANKLISQEDYDAAKKKLDADYADQKKALDDKNKEAEKKAQDEIDEKKAEIEYQAAKRAKALAIANAIINGAAAVIAALATPFAGPALAIAAGLIAAANLAAIIATPIPDNRKGTSSTSSSSSTTTTTTTSVPNTTSTTNGIVNTNTNNNTAVTTAIVTANQKDTPNYVPVLVTSDLTYEFDKSAKIEVMNKLT